MAAVTKAPDVEAMSAIVDRINSGDLYEMDGPATYSEEVIDILEDIVDKKVDVVCESMTTLNETLDVEDRTSMAIRVIFRDKVPNVENATIDPLKLLVRRIFQRVNNFDSADGRVKVWECDLDPKEVPIKAILREHGLFVASILLRVEVEAS